MTLQFLWYIGIFFLIVVNIFSLRNYIIYCKSLDFINLVDNCLTFCIDNKIKLKYEIRYLYELIQFKKLFIKFWCFNLREFVIDVEAYDYIINMNKKIKDYESETDCKF